MSGIETSGRNTSEAPQTIDDARVMGVFESLATLILPDKQTAATIDQFTYQQLEIGLRQMGVDVWITDERLSKKKGTQVTYFFSKEIPVRKRNFMLLTQLGREVNKDKVAPEQSMPPVSTEVVGKKRGRRRRRVSRMGINVLTYTLDLSPVYEWEKQIVEKLKQKHPDSVFVKGLQQSLIDYLPE